MGINISAALVPTVTEKALTLLSSPDSISAASADAYVPCTQWSDCVPHGACCWAVGYCGTCSGDSAPINISAALVPTVTDKALALLSSPDSILAASADAYVPCTQYSDCVPYGWCCWAVGYCGACLGDSAPSNISAASADAYVPCTQWSDCVPYGACCWAVGYCGTCSGDSSAQNISIAPEFV